MTERPQIRSFVIAVALGALVAWSFWQRWLVLTETPFPNGIDGYYYSIQVRALLEDGSLAYPASPLAFWLLAPFAAATDPILGVKLGAAFYTALVALPAYALGARLGTSRGVGVLAAVIAATSAGSMFLAFEFVKNGVGITLALTALWLVLRALEHPTYLRRGLAVLAIVATLLAHKSAAALVVAIAVPAAIADATRRGALRGRRLIYAIGGLGLFAILAVVAGILFPESFLSARDALLVSHALSSDMHWDAPALVGVNDLTMGYEAAIGGVLAIAALCVLAAPIRARLVMRLPEPLRPPRRPAADSTAAWAFAILALVIALPWLDVRDPQGLAFRLRVIAFVPMTLCAAVVARVLVPQVLRLAPPRGWPQREYVIVGIAIALLVATPRTRSDGRILAHPAMISAIENVAPNVPADRSLVVPERHLAYMTAWYARVPVRIDQEAVPVGRRLRLLPLSFIGLPSQLGHPSPLDRALLDARDHRELEPPIGVHPLHANGLVLVPEPTWQWALDQLPPELRAHYAAWPTI